MRLIRALEHAGQWGGDEDFIFYLSWRMSATWRRSRNVVVSLRLVMIRSLIHEEVVSKRNLYPSYIKVVSLSAFGLKGHSGSVGLERPPNLFHFRAPPFGETISTCKSNGRSKSPQWAKLVMTPFLSTLSFVLLTGSIDRSRLPAVTAAAYRIEDQYGFHLITLC